MSSNKFGNNLRRIRNERGLSVRGLAKLTEDNGDAVIFGTISVLENRGEESRSIQVVRALAHALGVSVSELID